MSDDKDKIKHSKRLLKDDNAIKKQLKIVKNNHMIDEAKFLKEPHRYHKHHVMDCGNTQCTVCGNRRRVYKERTLQEKKLFQDLDSVRDTHSNGIQNDEESILRKKG